MQWSRTITWVENLNSRWKHSTKHHLLTLHDPNNINVIHVCTKSAQSFVLQSFVWDFFGVAIMEKKRLHFAIPERLIRTLSNDLRRQCSPCLGECTCLRQHTCKSILVREKSHVQIAFIYVVPHVLNYILSVIFFSVDNCFRILVRGICSL